jgi:hypothetical protein
MAKAIIARKYPTKADEWRGLIAEQARSGLSIKEFCKERSHTVVLLRLAQTAAGGRGSAFRVVERGAAEQECATGAHLELVLAEWRAIAHPFRGRRAFGSDDDRHESSSPLSKIPAKNHPPSRFTK